MIFRGYIDPVSDVFISTCHPRLLAIHSQYTTRKVSIANVNHVNNNGFRAIEQLSIDDSCPAKSNYVSPFSVCIELHHHPIV